MKRISVIALGILLVAVMCSCGSNETKSKEDADLGKITADLHHDRAAELGQGFAVGKVVGENDVVKVTCTEIQNDGIIFQIENKTDKSVTIDGAVSLDGYLTDLMMNGFECDIPAHTTQYAKMEGELANTEHALMSASFTLIIDSTEMKSLDIDSVDLGGAAHPATIPAAGQELYSADSLSVTFQKFGTDEIFLTVANTNDEGRQIQLKNAAIDGSDADIGCLALIPSHTEGVLEALVTPVDPQKAQSFTFTLEISTLDGQLLSTSTLSYGINN